MAGKIPDEREMEKYASVLDRLLRSEDSGSEEELDRYLKQLMESGSGPEMSPKEAVDLAQDIMYDAWETEDPDERVALALKALDVSPDCADAYVLLAEEEAETLEEEKRLYKKAVEAGKRALGPERFKKWKGHFWGFIESRPYMRARAGLALTLWEMGEVDEAIKHYRAMLRLNKDDNQGIRYVLIKCLAELGRYDELERFMNGKAFRNDCGTEWLYTKALLNFVRGGASKKAERELEISLKRNLHVVDYLLGRKKPPRALPDRITMGGEDEAMYYGAEFGRAWERVDGALEWLAQKAGALGRRETGRNEPCACGSGKKYKKSCPDREQVGSFSLPEEFKTGTPVDTYMDIINRLSIFCGSGAAFSGDREEFYDKVTELENRFRPGSEGRVPDSLVYSWLFLDFRFGKKKATVCERFLESADADSLPEGAAPCALDLLNSYFTFYEVSAVSDEYIFLEELGSGKIWRVVRIGGSFEDKALEGNIWYIRLAGPSGRAYALGSPYCFDADDKEDILEDMKKLEDAFIDCVDVSEWSEEDIFIETCKVSVWTWLKDKECGGK